MSFMEDYKGANSELVYPVGPRVAQLLLDRIGRFAKLSVIFQKDRNCGLFL
jgi:hypothetical protein